jgi:cellobiose PTS system EIIB component
MRILVVCGAGASSTFVAQRIRRAAGDRGIELTATASAWPMSAEDARDAEVILIGPHLDGEADRVRAWAGAGPRTVVLPDDVFSDLDGSRTLALALAALERETPSPRHE